MKLINQIAYLFDRYVMWKIAEYGNNYKSFGEYMRKMYPSKFKKEIEYLNQNNI